MTELNKHSSFQRRILPALLRVFFYLLYNQFAWIYDWFAGIVSIGKWKGWVLTVLPYLNGHRILEMGHGPGHLQLELQKKNVEVVGLDRSYHMGRVAFKRMKSTGFLPLLVNGYAQLLPFADQVFNQVVATFPTEYILDLVTLNEVWRVLAPGGALVVIPVAWITGNRWFERMAAWLFRFSGQAPEWDDHTLEPVRTAGFKVQVERQSSNSSEILIVLAQKP